jgi:hypothetical protein
MQSTHLFCVSVSVAFPACIPLEMAPGVRSRYLHRKLVFLLIVVLLVLNFPANKSLCTIHRYSPSL